MCREREDNAHYIVVKMISVVDGTASKSHVPVQITCYTGNKLTPLFLFPCSFGYNFKGQYSLKHKRTITTPNGSKKGTVKQKEETNPLLTFCTLE